MDKRTQESTQPDVDLKSIRIKFSKALNLQRLHERLRAGHVVRYHTRPELSEGQNVAAHTWRAMVILQTLFPDVSKNCMIHLMYHDVAEAETGDMPATTKWKYPQLNKLMEQIENDHEDKIGVGSRIYKVTVLEKSLCDIADKLELILHCYRLMQTGNSLAEDVFIKGINYLQENYRKLDEFQQVQEIINALTIENKKSTAVQATLENLYKL